MSISPFRSAKAASSGSKKFIIGMYLVSIVDQIKSFCYLLVNLEYPNFPFSNAKCYSRSVSFEHEEIGRELHSLPKE